MQGLRGWLVRAEVEVGKEKKRNKRNSRGKRRHNDNVTG
jgi:hypothetical protein